MPGRMIAFLLICIEAFTLGFLGKSFAFPFVIFVISLAALTTSFRLKLQGRRLFVVVAGLAFLFFAKYHVVPANPVYQWGSFRIQAALIICQFMISLQVLHLFAVRGDARGLSLAIFPGMGAVALVCASVVRAPARDRLILQLLFVAFALLSAVYAARTRSVVATASRKTSKRRAVSLITISVAIALLGWFGARTLYRYERQIDDLVTTLLRSDQTTNTIGFSGSARLGSVQHQKNTASDKIAVRVICQTRPGYLRGKTFDKLHASAWTSSLGQLSLDPLSNPPDNIPELPSGHRLFAADSVAATQWKVATFWPDPSYATRMFVPLGTTHVTAAINEVAVDRDRIYQSDELLPGRPYAALVPMKDVRAQPQNIDFTPLKQLPGELDPRIGDLAAEVFAGRASTREKIEAVRDYFAKNYTYSLSISVPDDRDPLAYFLLERPPAHCEYFATGAAVLLRKAGVPCRYVTGFVAAEKNRYGDYWVARNRDAHAWVEAYDEQLGWVTVEATPSAGVPAGEVLSSNSQWWESIKDRAHMTLVTLQEGGIPALTALIARILLSWPVALLVAIVLLVRIVALHLRKRHRHRIRRQPEFRELHKLLGQMDARLSKSKLERRPGETLNQFADRIEPNPVANWYRDYASVRYGQNREERVEILIERMAKS